MRWQPLDIEYVKVKCECGHIVSFLSNHSAICRYCGKTVYPSKRCEFKEKLSKEKRKRDFKYEQSMDNRKFNKGC